MLPGTIVTFYSYKGGTGRTMALANAACLLAAAGHSVLAIDWDLEAPGLHRYLHPFLADPDLSNTSGLIDLIWDYALAAAREGTKDRDFAPLRLADPAHVATPTTFRAEGADEPGCLHMLGAGMQNAVYADRVRNFNWGRMFTRLKGEEFVRRFGEKCRKQYEYTLIDSRTGIADTAGIATVALPDRVVLCFTPNRQSVLGVRAVGASIMKARSSLRLLPVVTRVEKGVEGWREAQAFYRAQLDHLLPDKSDSATRVTYWGGAEIVHYPNYALGELLATFGDSPDEQNSLLSDMRRLVSRIVETEFMSAREAFPAPLFSEEAHNHYIRRIRFRDPRVADLQAALEGDPSTGWTLLSGFAAEAWKETNADPNWVTQLASGFSTLAGRFAGAGDTTRALMAIREAVEAHRWLNQQDKERFAPALAISLNQLSLHSSAAGDRQGARSAIREAVEIRRRLADESPAQYELDLAQSLHLFSNRLSDDGENDGALAAIRETTNIYRRLARENPTRHASDLAQSLSVLSHRLREAGDRAGAIEAIQEAVDMYRGLTDTNPARFGAELSQSLNTLSFYLKGIRASRAFVIRPSGKRTDASGKVIDFDLIDRELVQRALREAGLPGSTTGQVIEVGSFREDIFALIIESDLVVCDITLHDANVFYELGIRHALRKKHTVLIKGGPVEDGAPFDLLTDRCVRYELANPAAALLTLTDVIRATLISDRETDSPVFKMLLGLPEVNAAVIQAVPTDFGEDVARARAAESAGWLRLLASEVAGLRFQWPALRIVAQAQWNLRDYDGARKTWERIRDNDPDDLSANLALANLFERQYRREKRQELLESSNLAIARVLRNDKLSASQRAEANALRARNLKTLWRLDFEAQPDLAKRRETATNRALREAYEAYRRAYLGDLNHYGSGLAALQQGTIAVALSDGEAWQDAFDNSDQADAYKGELKRQVEALRPMVSQAIEAELTRTDPSNDERLWAKISAADLTFLVEERSKRVVEAYKNAIPRNGLFAWDAAKGQLQLFALLGIKADLANEAIGMMDALVDRSEPDKVARSEPDKKVLHTIVFTGHRVDEAGREKPRFPPDRETKARDLIREKLKAVVDASTRVHVLSSADPGSDILCHEICRELGINSTICLPMPKESFARLMFSNEENWRARFFDLVSSRPVLQLSDQEDLPRWLTGSSLNARERGNRWVLEMAQASGAAKVTLIALWDGKTTSDSPGGTAHMVGLARDAGTVVEVRIDARQLLA